MGRAKKRGTFEQRKAEAVERDIQLAMERRKLEAIRPRGKSRANQILAQAMAIAAGSALK
jgi:hypothetical protein